MAKDLAIYFVINVLPHIDTTQIVLATTPYKVSKSASYFLAQSMQKYLNFELYKKGLSSCLLLETRRTTSHRAGYANLKTKEERESFYDYKIMADKDLLESASTLVYIDDLMATGSSWKLFQKQISPFANKVIPLFWVELKDTSPEIEESINRSAYGSDTKLVELLKDSVGDLVATRNFISYILKNKLSLPCFNMGLVDFLLEVYYTTLGEENHRDEKQVKGFLELQTLLISQGLI